MGCMRIECKKYKMKNSSFLLHFARKMYDRNRPNVNFLLGTVISTTHFIECCPTLVPTLHMLNSKMPM